MIAVHDPERDARLLELYAADWTYTAIGGELGLTKNQVAGLVNRSDRAQEIRPTRKRQPPNFQPVLLTGLAAIEARTGGARVSQAGCRWIYGHPNAGEAWHWCGAKRLPDSPYCAAHRALTVQTKPAPPIDQLVGAKDQAA
jgi:hypothetical protein